MIERGAVIQKAYLFKERLWCPRAEGQVTHLGMVVVQGVFVEAGIL
jgi:hypothetical protein